MAASRSQNSVPNGGEYIANQAYVRAQTGHLAGKYSVLGREEKVLYFLARARRTTVPQALQNQDDRPNFAFCAFYRFCAEEQVENEHKTPHLVVQTDCERLSY